MNDDQRTRECRDHRRLDRRDQKAGCVLAANLRELRHYHGYSQEEIAACLGISRNMYVRYESGESSPPADKLAAAARLYQIPLRILTGQKLASRDDLSTIHTPDDLLLRQIYQYEHLTTVSKYAIIEMMRMLQLMEGRLYGIRSETEK